MTTLFLVRHAVHDLVGKTLVGRAPGVPLSAEGRRQAGRLRERFAAEQVDQVLSSPVERARETAAILAGAKTEAVAIEDALAEIDCGEWTGKSFDELSHDPRWQVWNTERHNAAIPGGETMAAVKARVSGLLDRLAEAPGPLVLVSHSDVIKAAIAALIDMPLHLHDRIEIEPASITTVEMWRPGAGKLIRMNEVVAP